MNATVSWKGGMKFEGLSKSGRPILLDGGPETGGENAGPRPMETLLFALGGCTGMDVVSIMNKMQLPYTSFWMEIEAHRQPEHPKYFHTIHVTYHVTGHDLPRERVERAVALSRDKYCSVMASLKAQITTAVVLHEPGEEAQSEAAVATTGGDEK